ncbi:hypothetical protein F5Y19DRAFT_231502 [Xylariaceae sp. FL1651]|nr:hypothetical protein F5Y19DRAFT_231502 [Xylariaceae sp. FL1651]
MSRAPSPSYSSEAYSRSPSPSRHRPRSQSTRSEPYRRRRSPSPTSEDKIEAALKTSLVFLGAVGAATLVAHKFWPKGIIYGESEEYGEKEKHNGEARERTKRAHRGEGGGNRSRGRHYGRPEEVPHAPDRHRYEDVSYQRESVYAPEYILPGSRPVDQRRIIETSRGRHPEDESRDISREYIRDERVAYDSHGRGETRGMQSADRSAPRPRIYIDDDGFPSPTKSTRSRSARSYVPGYG